MIAVSLLARPHASRCRLRVRLDGSGGVRRCVAWGRTMEPAGRAQIPQCVIVYADAGKRCMTGSDCAGDCRITDAPFPDASSAAADRCQADSTPFGCHAKVENGKAVAALRID